MLDDRQRTLYARHLLLPEIGKEGQEALCAARVRAGADADAHALSVARDYLERAGVQVGETEGVALELPSASDLGRIDPALRDAIAAVAGAFAAVEAIKSIVGVGEPGSLEIEVLE